MQLQFGVLLVALATTNPPGRLIAVCFYAAVVLVLGVPYC